jgi:hypothetical protein
MPSRKLALSFAQEFLLALVFLSAAWINAGIHPNEDFLKDVFLYVYNLLPNAFLFWVLPFFIIFFSVIGSYFISGWSGIIALALIFSGEFFKDGPLGILLLLIGIVIGFFASLRE